MYAVQPKFAEVRFNCAHSIPIDFGVPYWWWLRFNLVDTLRLILRTRRIDKYLNASLVIYVFNASAATITDDHHFTLQIETFACDWLRVLKFNWIRLNNAFRVRNYQLNKQYVELNGAVESDENFDRQSTWWRKWGFPWKVPWHHADQFTSVN